ncbi:hypothetical protein V6N12_022248 [Hibiscus sabdariffa]|uniref:EamA domain-containing protein n=1 Tax=Hibiscus sabdariffa TaxID=183260 RepID=A0ABR2FU42_9ROSI
MEVVPSLAMLAVEFTNVVLSILFKAASSKGLSYNIFTLYYSFIGTFVFIPIFFFRKTVFPSLKFHLVSRLCLLGIIGVVGNLCGSKGIELGSPTLASAISNLTPAFTFILAVSFRMERVELRRAATQAKIIGTIASVSGAFVMIFYKGPKIISSLPWTSSSSSVLQLESPESNWIIGGILGAVSNLLFSFWYIIQAQVMKIYPDEIAVTFFYNLSVALLALPVCLVAEPQLSSWRLTSSVSVVAVLYTGLFAHSFSAGVHTWGVRLKGPVFVAIFRPTSIVIAAVMGAIFLGEALYLGSVIGAVIITGGLYAVLWGKAKEAEEMRDDDESCGLSRLGPSSDGGGKKSRREIAGGSAMEVLPSSAMVAVECSHVVISILFKAASSKGLSYYNFIAYCYVLGTLVFTLLVFSRNTVFPPLKSPLISRLCLLGITGYLGMICAYKGIEMGSPTLASAISNLTPAFTFILAVSFRMEKVELRRAATQAKIIGTITSISGALVMTFYKGSKVFSSSPWRSSSSVPQLQSTLHSSRSNWIVGGILEVIAYLLYSLWYVIQAQVMKIYPEEIAVTFFYNLSVALLAIPVCLIAEPLSSSWRLTHSISVAAVLYSGLFGFSFSSCVHTWGVRLKGPVFVAVFKPTSIVIAAVLSATFLGEALYLGSVIGAVIITSGLYAVLWGKAKESREMGEDDEPCGLSRLGPSSSDAGVPLLQPAKL